MRLTLRTLLAYRDGVLTPQQQEDLHLRIQQNRPVAHLLHQINELIRSSELRTPKLNVPGIGDANSVAEYLDDALSGQTVAELERLCLHNAEHLCELAHCHQLLADALNTHVKVPESLQEVASGLMDPKQRELIRSRLLTKSGRSPLRSPSETNSALPIEDQSQPDSAGLYPETQNAVVEDSSRQNSPDHDASEAGSQAGAILPANSMSPMLTATGGSIRQAGLDLESTPLASEVPAYLLASQRKRWQIPAAIASLSFLLVFLIWHSLGSVDSLRSLWHMKPGEPDSPVAVKSNNAPTGSNTVPQSSENAAADSTKEKASEVQPDKGQPGKETPGKETPGKETPVKDQPANEKATQEQPLTERAVVEAPSVSAIDSNLSEGIVENQASESSTPLGESPQSEADGPSSIPVGLSTVAGNTGQGRAVVLVVPESRQATSGNLQLLGEQPQPLMLGRVIVPPSVRIPLQMGFWQWTVGGATTALIDLEAPIPVLESQLLRGVFTSIDKAQPMMLKTPIGSLELTILEESAWLAVEVASRPVTRGSMSEPNTYVPALIIVAGSDAAQDSGELARLKWVEGDQNFLLRQVAQGLAIVGDPVSGDPMVTEFSLQNPPRWYGSRSVRLIDQEASQDFYVALRDRQIPIREQIDLLVRHERPELAALAIQSSLLLGNWRPLVSELLVADRLRAHWTPTIDLARQLAVVNPMAQETVQELLQEDFGADAKRLSDLFLGLRKQQLEAEGLAGLLKGLESESLPMRILSAYELTQLTGSDHGYLPHAPVKATVQQIRRLQSTGKLTIRPVGDPIVERTPQL